MFYSELEALKNTSLEQLWLKDIEELEDGIKKYEAEQAKKEADSQKTRKLTSKKKYVNDYADNLG